MKGVIGSPDALQSVIRHHVMHCLCVWFPVPNEIDAPDHAFEPLVQARSVRRNRASHVSRDGVVRRMAQDLCVIHSKLTFIHATK